MKLSKNSFTKFAKSFPDPDLSRSVRIVALRGIDVPRPLDVPVPALAVEARVVLGEVRPVPGPGPVHAGEGAVDGVPADELDRRRRVRVGEGRDEGGGRRHEDLRRLPDTAL